MVIPLNDFAQTYIGNILKGIVTSLGQEAGNISVDIVPDGLNIYNGDSEVPVNKEYMRSIIEQTIKGMLKPINGVYWLNKVTITTND